MPGCSGEAGAARPRTKCECRSVHLLALRVSQSNSSSVTRRPCSCICMSCEYLVSYGLMTCPETPRNGTEMDKLEAVLSIIASSGRNCVDIQALCLVASSRSTSHSSSSFFLACEAAFSRAPKRPFAIVLVTSPNLYSLLPVASRTAPSKPLMAPRVKSPNS